MKWPLPVMENSRYLMAQLPKYSIIHLKLFDISDGERRSPRQPSFNIDLNMSDYCTEKLKSHLRQKQSDIPSEEASTLYKLMGVTASPCTGSHYCRTYIRQDALNGIGDTTNWWKSCNSHVESVKEDLLCDYFRHNKRFVLLIDFLADRDADLLLYRRIEIEGQKRLLRQK